ncbi:hypothetical protein [Brumimicrobium mesophilum]|uniref:hypothetical protein n=1 Tax=Brumimicrobium mesophilum TaxID=392717 RepID=UPI000D13F188|nr:hypothetical protein [Brumimicrobium mesophilum]
MKELENIDDLFKDEFEGFLATPDASLKSAIDESLFSNKKERKIGFWLFFAASFLGLFALLIGICFTPSSSQKVSNAPVYLSKINVNNDKKDETETELDIDLKAIQKTQNNLMNVDAKPVNIEKEAVINPSILFNKQQNSFKAVEIKNLSNLFITPKLNVNFLSKKGLTNSIEVSPLRQVLVHVNKTSSLGLEGKKQSHGSLTGFVNYAFESSRSNRSQEGFENLENGTIHIHTSEFRLEYQRNISSSFSINLGLGFAHHNILQRGELTTWDSIPKDIGVSMPDTFIFVPTFLSEDIKYKFQQINVGIGLTYNRVLLQNWNLDLTAGSNFSVGKFSELDESSQLETPEISTYGITLFVRPAIAYKIGKYSLMAFGQVNQNLKSHFNWEFLERRNPSFGGGLALRYYF